VEKSACFLVIIIIIIILNFILRYKNNCDSSVCFVAIYSHVT